MKPEQPHPPSENLDSERDRIFSRVFAEGKYDLRKIGDTITDFLKDKSARLSVDYLGRLRNLFVSRASGKIQPFLETQDHQPRFRQLLKECVSGDGT